MQLPFAINSIIIIIILNRCVRNKSTRSLIDCQHHGTSFSLGKLNTSIHVQYALDFAHASESRMNKWTKQTNKWMSISIKKQWTCDNGICRIWILHDAHLMKMKHINVRKTVEWWRSIVEDQWCMNDRLWHTTCDVIWTNDKWGFNQNASRIETTEKIDISIIQFIVLTIK